MNTIKAQEGGYLTQIAYDIPIEERIFVKVLTGVKATYEYYREATEEEIEAWLECQAKQEEEQRAMMGGADYEQM